MIKKIPIPYQVILNKLLRISYEQEIAVGKVRYILSWFFRMGKENIRSIFDEMKELGLIEFKNHRMITILINRSELES